MIDVVYDRDQNKLTITGHARSAEYGKDLICAAVSALALTLGANVGNMAANGYVGDPVVVLEPGNAQISCTAQECYRDSVRQVYMSICVGFEVLEAEYPDYISYRVVGW